MSGLLGQRAVVVGAGIGGLAMAGTLAKYFRASPQIASERRSRKRPPTPEGTYALSSEI
jgi:hypothetical protein